MDGGGERGRRTSGIVWLISGGGDGWGLSIVLCIGL